MFTTGEEFLGRVGALPGVEEVYAPDGTPGPRYNLAPTQAVPIIRVTESLAQVDPARWGLFPHWKKDDSGPPLFNARAETVAEKPSFRDAFSAQRCVLPLDGYYEWFVAEDGKTKTPYYVSPGEGEMLWAAGLWSTGLDQLSATMITTDSAEPLEWLHHRLPRFLADDEVEQWTKGSAAEAGELLHPSPERVRESLSWRKAAKEVGNVRNDYPELLDSAAGGLF